MLMIKGLMGVTVQMALFAALLLLPAGTWQWPDAIQFLVAHGVLSFIATIVLAMVEKKNPGRTYATDRKEYYLM